MNENYNLKKYGADKIAFLGMFIIAVLIAQLMVSINSNLDFSEPIELANTGLSISIPTGKGWQNTKQWINQDEEFTLSSNFMTTRGLPDIAVNCKYFINTQNLNPQNLFEQQTDDPNAAISKIKLIQKGDLKIQWVNFQAPYNIFLGFAELPNNRTVTVEVFETTFDIYLAESIFKQIIESLSFDENNLVKAGAEFITEIKNKGIESLLNNSDPQSCFFFQDSINNNIGFTIDVLGKINSNEQNVIRGASYIFWAGPNIQEQKTIFSCNTGLNKFTWQNQTIAKDLKVGGIITLDDSGTITVTNDVNGKLEKHENCSNVIPSILLEPLISPAIENNIEDVIIDIIDSKGIISPTIFSLRPADETEEGYSYILTLKPFFSNESPDYFYLNDNNLIIKSTGSYYLERTDTDNIIKEFPQMTETISKITQLLITNSL